tara:strand:+ start:7988 stop:8320 length:333 start_codon:yes stop_codon:yes gene_type:complete
MDATHHFYNEPLFCHIALDVNPMRAVYPLLITLSFSLLSIPAYAIPHQSQDDILQRLDKNADGQISIKEAVADPFILESFSRIDINGDGIISRHELTSVHLRRSHGHGLN